MEATIFTHSEDFLTVKYHGVEKEYKIEKFSVGPDDFFLSSVWVNNQPAKHIKNFKFRRMEAEGLLSFRIQQEQLFLTFNQENKLGIKLYCEGAEYPLEIDPNLTTYGLRMFLKRVHQLDLKDYELKSEDRVLPEKTHPLKECFKNNKDLKITAERQLEDSLYLEEQELEDLEYGSFPFNSLENTVQIPFSVYSPSYRRVDKGLNFEGKCENAACTAEFKKIFRKVIHPTHQFDAFEFHISHWRFEAKCPVCEVELKDVTNCIFWDCMFSIRGVRKDGLKFEQAEKKQAPRDHAISFKELVPEDMIRWKNLVITTEPVTRPCTLF